jgi:hypothetical protein
MKTVTIEQLDNLKKKITLSEDLARIVEQLLWVDDVKALGNIKGYQGGACFKVIVKTKFFSLFIKQKKLKNSFDIELWDQEGQILYNAKKDIFWTGIYDAIDELI